MKRKTIIVGLMIFFLSVLGFRYSNLKNQDLEDQRLLYIKRSLGESNYLFDILNILPSPPRHYNVKILFENSKVLVTQTQYSIYFFTLLQEKSGGFVYEIYPNKGFLIDIHSFNKWVSELEYSKEKTIELYLEIVATRKIKVKDHAELMNLVKQELLIKYDSTESIFQQSIASDSTVFTWSISSGLTRFDFKFEDNTSEFIWVKRNMIDNSVAFGVY